MMSLSLNQDSSLMEAQEPTSDFDQSSTTNKNLSSIVDTSRPFRSVKEAVAIFDERLLAGVFFSPHPFTTIGTKQETPTPPKPPILPPLLSSSLPSTNTEHEKQIIPKEDSASTFGVKNMLKKLQVELDETKHELNLLKERETETEIALASLNAELHKNMSRMAEAEAVAAGANAVVAGEKVLVPPKRGEFLLKGGNYKYHSQDEDGIIREEIISSSPIMKMGYGYSSSSIAEIMTTLGEKDYFDDMEKEKKKKMKMLVKKKKPIVPLVGDWFSRKKDSSKSLYNPLYTSSDPISFN